MPLTRPDGSYNFGTLTSVIALLIGLFSGMYALAIRPVEDGVSSNRSDIRRNTDLSRRVEISTTRIDVLVTKQNETLNKLATAVDKLADRLSGVTRGQ